MGELRKIDPRPFAARVAASQPLPAVQSPKPQLRWIATDCLRVDPTYQRDISTSGTANILKIARSFDWSMFTPVIVVEAEAGIYLVIDGQHRTTAAVLRGVRDVPCQIVVADRIKQAAAFTAINGNVTRLTSQQLHHARVAAGQPDAVVLDEACAAAGVTILRYPLAAGLMKTGDTLAAFQLDKVLKKYGRETFVPACRCITQTRKGNPGFVRGPIAEGLCAVLEAEPTWRDDEDKLLKAMWRFDFAGGFERARTESAGKHSLFASAFVEIVGEHLEKNFGAAAA